MDSLAMSQRRRRLEEARRALELIGGAGRDAVRLRWIAVAGRSRRCEAGAPIGSGWGASASGSSDEVGVGSDQPPLGQLRLLRAARGLGVVGRPK